jgi:hypothetical protein
MEAWKFRRMGRMPPLGNGLHKQLLAKPASAYQILLTFSARALNVRLAIDNRDRFRDPFPNFAESQCHRQPPGPVE